MTDNNPQGASTPVLNHNNGKPKWISRWGRATPEDVFAVAQEVFGGKYWNVRRDAQHVAENT